MTIPAATADHDDIRVRLGLFVLGALPIDECLLVEEHLAGCAECRVESEELGRLASLLARLSPVDRHALADEFAPGRSAAEGGPPRTPPRAADTG